MTPQPLPEEKSKKQILDEANVYSPHRNNIFAAMDYFADQEVRKAIKNWEENHYDIDKQMVDLLKSANASLERKFDEKCSELASLKSNTSKGGMTERVKELIYEDDFKKWRIKEGWSLHSSREYWYKLDYPSQWPTPHVKSYEEMEDEFRNQYKPESGEVNGMKWVKASERLPEEHAEVIVRFVPGHTLEVEYMYVEDNNWHEFSEGEWSIIHLGKDYQIEWLDETLQPSGQEWPTEEESKAAHYNWAMSYGKSFNPVIVWDAAIQWLKQRLK